MQRLLIAAGLVTAFVPFFAPETTRILSGLQVLYYAGLLVWRRVRGVEEFLHHVLTCIFLVNLDDWRILSSLGLSQLLYGSRSMLPGGSIWLVLFRCFIVPYLISTNPISTYNYTWVVVFTFYLWYCVVQAVRKEFPSDYRMLIFHVIGFLQNSKFVHIKDFKVFDQIMRRSFVKGKGLEYFIACPAWHPIRSIESIDGQEWKNAHENMKLLLANIPEPKNLERIAISVLEKYTSNSRVLVADDIVRFTIESCLKYLFDLDWEPRFELFVRASWEWRRELAVKGRADAKVKMDSVLLMLDILKVSRLWDLFGDDWALPEFYSLVMQPFIISPSINVSDVAVALKERARNESLMTTIRRAHPFPILERVVQDDFEFINESGIKKTLKRGTHAILFLDKVNSGCEFMPVFGSGVRVCAGSKHALSLLVPLRAAMIANEDKFDAKNGHLWSGRHNDGVSNWKEDLYFLKTIVVVLFWAAFK